MPAVSIHTRPSSPPPSKMRILEKSLDFSRISISYPLQLFNPPPALTLTPNRRYSAEFKVKVIEIMRAEGLNHSEAGRRFGIESHTLLQIWEWIYLAEGPEGFSVERRGHSGSGRPLKRVSQDREKELLAQVQRLEAENRYLKNCGPRFWKTSSASAKSAGDSRTEARNPFEDAAVRCSPVKVHIL